MVAQHNTSRAPRIHLQGSPADIWTADPLFAWRRMQVSSSSRSEAEPVVIGNLTREYNVRRTAEIAHGRGDPLLAPHGHFRNLAHGNHKHAVEFLEKFGPLTMTPGQKSMADNAVEVNMPDFWQKHRRFVLTVALYEQRNAPDRLEQAWRELHIHLHEFETEGIFPFGAVPINPFAEEAYSEWTHPWDLFESDSFERWLSSTSAKDLRSNSLDLVQGELNNHSFGRQLWWLRDLEGASHDRFLPFTRVDSLWSILWELFGLDTAGVLWRRCVGCRRFFYPKRRDQFYCSPREQALASKREYARRKRALAKAASKRARRDKEA